ncbi:MAG: hypothetical protein ACTSX9_09025 [Candidatus Njordarchaeales archaeon]
MPLSTTLFKIFITPFIVRTYKKWYEETVDWKKNDWRNWQAERFEEIKKSKWTLRHFPWLKEITYDDLTSIPVQEHYVEAPSDFPAFVSYQSTGTIEKKTVKFTKRDVMMFLKAIGRYILWLKGETQMKKGVVIGYPGLIVWEFGKLFDKVFCKKCYLMTYEEFLKKKKEIAKRSPLDSALLTLPVAIPFIENLERGLFTSPSFFFVGGDVVTDYIRLLLHEKTLELDLLAYLVDIYGTSEISLGGMEIPPRVTKANAYVPETFIGLIKKTDGSLVNIFDAKRGEEGELIATTLAEYTVPNYNLRDVVRIVNEETPLGVPSFQVLGKSSRKVHLALKTLGEIRGLSAAFFRVKGISINSFALVNFIGKSFASDCLILIEEKEKNVYMRIFVEKPINEEEFFSKLQEDPDIGYLIDDMKIGILNIEIIHDNEVINDLREVVRRKWGLQAEHPRVILLKDK